MSEDKAGKKQDRVFEVIHGSVSIGKGATRAVGDELRESELPEKTRAATIESLTKRGFIRDTAQPLAPAAVTKTINDHFIGLAQDVGLITNEGATYKFGKQTFKGREALRQAITAADVVAAIKEHLAGKDAAIAELTKKTGAEK